MFGIGFEEFFLIAIVLLIAVGPDKMPTFLKAVGKGVREFRRATRELKSSVGLDELMRDEDLRELRKPLSDTLKASGKRPSPGSRYALTEEDRRRELPPEGVDLAHASAHPPAATAAGAPSSPTGSAVETPRAEDAPGGEGPLPPKAGEGA